MGCEEQGKIDRRAVYALDSAMPPCRLCLSCLVRCYSNECPWLLLNETSRMAKVGVEIEGDGTRRDKVARAYCWGRKRVEGSRGTSYYETHTHTRTRGSQRCEGPMYVAIAVVLLLLDGPSVDGSSLAQMLGTWEGGEGGLGEKGPRCGAVQSVALRRFVWESEGKKKQRNNRHRHACLTVAMRASPDCTFLQHSERRERRE